MNTALTALGVASRRTGIGLIGVIVALVFMVGMAYGDGFAENGWNLTLRNDTNVIQNYLFYWVDHDYRDTYPEPMNLAGGELKPGEEVKLYNSYKPGIYYVMWGERNKEYKAFPFTVKPGTKYVMSGPAETMVGSI